MPKKLLGPTLGFQIRLTPDLAEAVARVAGDQGKSEYIRAVVRADLERRGELPPTPRDPELPLDGEPDREARDTSADQARKRAMDESFSDDEAWTPPPSRGARRPRRTEAPARV